MLILNLLEEACRGRPEPLLELCDAFDEETERGQNMEAYNDLLAESMDHVQRAHKGFILDQLQSNSNPSFVLPLASETPKSDSDLELVTWLVIRE